VYKARNTKHTTTLIRANTHSPQWERYTHSCNAKWRRPSSKGMSRSLSMEKCRVHNFARPRRRSRRILGRHMATCARAPQSLMDNDPPRVLRLANPTCLMICFLYFHKASGSQFPSRSSAMMSISGGFSRRWRRQPHVSFHDTGKRYNTHVVRPRLDGCDSSHGAQNQSRAARKRHTSKGMRMPWSLADHHRRPKAHHPATNFAM